MIVCAYLNFQNQCKEAFQFYERVIGGKIILMQTFGETPMKDHTPPEGHGAILHARLELDGGQVLMGSDAPPEMSQTPQGFAVAVVPETAEEAERIFAALSEGGTVTMPMGKTFWAERFGAVTDRFGTPWMVDCELKA